LVNARLSHDAVARHVDEHLLERAPARIREHVAEHAPHSALQLATGRALGDRIGGDQSHGRGVTRVANLPDTKRDLREMKNVRIKLDGLFSGSLVSDVAARADETDDASEGVSRRLAHGLDGAH
jgi:hypothetical protein